MLITALMFAQAAAAAAAPAPAQGQTPTAKVECRLIQEVGSRIPERVCRLDKEWEMLAKDAQDDLNRSANQRRNPGNTAGK